MSDNKRLNKKNLCQFLICFHNDLKRALWNSIICNYQNELLLFAMRKCIFFSKKKKRSETRYFNLFKLTSTIYFPSLLNNSKNSKLFISFNSDTCVTTYHCMVAVIHCSLYLFAVIWQIRLLIKTEILIVSRLCTVYTTVYCTVVNS